MDALLKPSDKTVRVTNDLFEANHLVYKKDYSAAFNMYSTIMEDCSHPVAFLNRALCYLALGKPHLAVNDALRAYMIAEHVIFEGSKSDQAMRFFMQIRHYADQCEIAVDRKAKWPRAQMAIFEGVHNSYRLSKMTLRDDHAEAVEEAGQPRPRDDMQRTVLSASPVYDLKFKALFRLCYALLKCGRGPAYAASHMLEGFFRATKAFTKKRTIHGAVVAQLKGVADLIQNMLMEEIFRGTLTSANYDLTMTRFSIIHTIYYGFADQSINYCAVDEAILKVDPNAIVGFVFDEGPVKEKPVLVATEDVFRSMIIFTESLPFVVSTENAPDTNNLAKTCDCCGAGLKIPAPFILLVLAEEAKQSEARRAKKKKKEEAEKQAPPTPSTIHEMEGVEQDSTVDPSGVPLPASDSASDQDADDYDEFDDDEEADGDEEDSHDSDRESGECSPSGSICPSIPPTPPRGRQRKRFSVLEASDLQICRSGNDKLRENFSFCSDECHEMAMSTYHDSICGTHLETYLRGAMITAEHPKVPSVPSQRLTLLLLVRVLGWAYATSTDPLDLPVVKLMLASLRLPPLETKGQGVTWSFHNNVLRPMQIFQAMDGRSYAPKSVKNPHNTDGRVLNTIIRLIERGLYVENQRRWLRTYDENGYLDDTIPFPTEELKPKVKKPEERDEEPVVFGRLHPLADLVPLAPRPELANVEIVDLGDNRIVCLPCFSAEEEVEGRDDRIAAGTPLYLKTAVPRMATASERATYAKLFKYDDYDDDDVMMEDEEYPNDIIDLGDLSEYDSEEYYSSEYDSEDEDEMEIDG